MHVQQTRLDVFMRVLHTTMENIYKVPVCTRFNESPLHLESD